jgi:hypothetical protein
MLCIVMRLSAPKRPPWKYTAGPEADVMEHDDMLIVTCCAWPMAEMAENVPATLSTVLPEHVIVAVSKGA